MARDDGHLDASRPLLGHERNGYDHTLSQRSSSHRSYASKSAQFKRIECFCFKWSTSASLIDDEQEGNASMISTLCCTESYCWKLIFPERIADYEDFATPAQMGEIHYLRQKSREFFDVTVPEDNEMIHHLWNGLFPTLPYDGRVNSRWRDVGFQNEDLASDLRSSGRLGLKMLLYFSDYMNDAFKRLIHENHFPVCVCALNVIEMLLIHLNLKDPVPLVCPCCGTDYAELETSHPIRPRPELKAFMALVQDAAHTRAMASSSGPLGGLVGEWSIEIAFAHVFMHCMLVLDAMWKRKLRQDPTTTLLHFREALLDTRKEIMRFLASHDRPTLLELQHWSTPDSIPN